MKRLSALLLPLALGSCITITSSRQYTVYQNGKEANTVTTTVDKKESIDGKVEGTLAGMQNTASASVNTTGGSGIKDALKKVVGK